MAKILLLAIAVWLLYAVVKRYLNGMAASEQAAEKSEDMVQCAHCGVHLPKSDSLLVGDRHFCCEAHSRQHTP